MIDYLIETLGRQQFIAAFFFYSICWSYCIIDSLRSQFKDPNMKWIWIVIVVLTQVIGVLIYISLSHFTKFVPEVGGFDDD
jgi:hypothetical protein